MLKSVVMMKMGSPATRLGRAIRFEVEDLRVLWSNTDRRARCQNCRRRSQYHINFKTALIPPHRRTQCLSENSLSPLVRGADERKVLNSKKGQTQP